MFKSLFIIFIIISLWILSLACSKSRKDEDVSVLKHYSYSDSCLSRKGEVRSDSAQVEIIINGLELTVIHKNAIFNCCLDSILLEFTHNDNILTLIENELATVPCRCWCPYKVEAEIKVPNPGDYILEIYTGSELVYRKKIHIPSLGTF
jgi:hypothetical protein